MTDFAENAQLGGLLPDLSPRQKSALTYIFQYRRERRNYPLASELALALGLKSVSSTTYIEPLIKKGYLVRDTSIGRRNLRLTEKGLEKLTQLGVNTDPIQPELFK